MMRTMGWLLGHQEAVQASENIVALAKITLNALVGSASSQTMRVRGRIKNREVVSLIDSRSTYNFLDASNLDNLRLPFDTSQILEVKVIDGSVVKTFRVCHGVTFFIQGYKFVLDLNVLHLGGVCSGSWNPMAKYIGCDHLEFQAIDHEVLLLG